MPLWKFSNLNKYGNLRHRIIHTESSQFSYKPKGLGPFVGVRRFKYTYEHISTLGGYFANGILVPICVE